MESSSRTRRSAFPRFKGRKPRKDLNTIPIHEQELAVDPQAESQLYNGKIPAEIRNRIFDYALSEYTKADDDLNPDSPRSSYPKNTHYSRPKYEGKKTMTVALLRTCRRIYLEAYHLPFQNKEMVFFHARGPPSHAGSTLAHYGEQEIGYFAQFETWQLQLVKEVHLFVQAFWLEGVFPRVAKHSFMQEIETIRITMRRGDWWNWESNTSLALSPQSGTVKAETMHQEWAAEKHGASIPWQVNQWGSAFAQMKGLKKVELEFETSDDKKDELKAIAAQALSWKFPAHSHGEGIEMVFSAQNFDPVWSSWEGPMCYWSDSCSYCGQHLQCLVTDPPNKGCVESAKLQGEERGPLCHVVGLVWKIGRKTARD